MKITKENFEALVLGSEKPVLLDFWATWCGPCMMIAPTIEEIEKENPQYLIGKVNVDESPELAAKYGIASIPAVFLFRNGEVVNQSVGFMQKPELERFVGI